MPSHTRSIPSCFLKSSPRRPNHAPTFGNEAAPQRGLILGPCWFPSWVTQRHLQGSRWLDPDHGSTSPDIRDRIIQNRYMSQPKNIQSSIGRPVRFAGIRTQTSLAQPVVLLVHRQRLHLAGQNPVHRHNEGHAKHMPSARGGQPDPTFDNFGIGFALQLPIFGAHEHMMQVMPPHCQNTLDYAAVHGCDIFTGGAMPSLTRDPLDILSHKQPADSHPRLEWHAALETLMHSQA